MNVSTSLYILFLQCITGRLGFVLLYQYDLNILIGWTKESFKSQALSMHYITDCTHTNMYVLVYEGLSSVLILYSDDNHFSMKHVESFYIMLCENIHFNNKLSMWCGVNCHFIFYILKVFFFKSALYIHIYTDNTSILQLLPTVKIKIWKIYLFV
jgi:hypothetical protein